MYTENQSELSHETIESLLQVKLNIPDRCHSLEISTNLASSLKKTAKAYNMKLLGASKTASAQVKPGVASTSAANSIDMIDVDN